MQNNVTANTKHKTCVVHVINPNHVNPNRHRSRSAKFYCTHQQFSFFTLSKSEALALARTSFRVSFITHQLRSRTKHLFTALYVTWRPRYDRLNGQTFQFSREDVYVRHRCTHAQINQASIVTVISCIINMYENICFDQTCNKNDYICGIIFCFL